jgi:RimJ/RimL family protein N-acetyltransferase
MIDLRALEEEDLEQLLKWRTTTPQAWRTPPPYTQRDMEAWYDDYVSANPPKGYYFGIYSDNILVGQGELSGLDWRSNWRIAEIGLMIDPDYQEKGIGTKSVELLLEYGFVEKELVKIRGEVNLCNEALEFWNKMICKYNGGYADEPCSKRYKGEWYAIRHFWFLSESWKTDDKK